MSVITKLPLENRHVVGVDGPPYGLNQRCAVVGCTEQGNERHHLWRRSFLIGDYWWVQLPTGEKVGNCVGLCNKHHMAVTTNNAEIRYLDGVFKWVPPTGDISRLAWQPPTQGDNPGEVVVMTKPDGSTSLGQWEGISIDPETGKKSVVKTEPNYVPEGETVYEGHPLAEERMYSREEFDHEHDHEGECPTCHQRIKPPKPQTPPEEKKNRRTWSIAVPKERQEDGADVLDILIDEARKELDSVGISYGDEHKYKYHVLSTSLALFVTHAKSMLANA